MKLKIYHLFFLLPLVVGTSWVLHTQANSRDAANGAALYVLIFAQDDPNIGVEPDVQTIQDICLDADEELPDSKMTVHVEVFNAKLMTKERIAAELRERNIGQRDAVWCYYSGHGSNYDGWPKTAGTGVPLSWTNQALMNTGARLTITTYDCCNWRDAEVTTELITFCVPSYTSLFVHSKGNIRMCSSQAGKLSYGLKNGGGIFTNALAENIGCWDTWAEVMQKTRAATSEGAKIYGLHQAPIYELSADFQDGTAR